MLEQRSFQTCPEVRLSSRPRMPAVSARPAPRQNHLLAALAQREYERLQPDLELIDLPLGRVVHCAGERENYLYFLTAGIVCRCCSLENGTMATFAISGREGVLGIGTFLGGESTLSQAVVVSAGSAYRLRADLLKNEFERGGWLQHLLLHYILKLVAQTGQTAVCNRHHKIEQQLCLWILSCLDRLPSSDLTITQELIANMLGVRREGITEAAGHLQKAGIISYSRGRITVLDRQKLEARACECYSLVKKEMDCFPGDKTAH